MEDGPGTGPPTAPPVRGASNSPECSHSVRCDWKERPRYGDITQSLVQLEYFRKSKSLSPTQAMGTHRSSGCSPQALTVV